MGFRYTEQQLAEIIRRPEGPRVRNAYSVGLCLPATTGDVQADNVERGRANQAAGRNFENYLTQYHDLLMAQYGLVIYKTDPPIRYSRKHKAFVPTGKGPADYIVFRAVGLPLVIFDAKSKSGNTYTVPARDEHQLDFLRSMADMGHIAGYFVRWVDFGEMRWHDVGDARGAKTFRHMDGILCEQGWFDAI